jgi:hypothetical protein
MRTRAFPSSWVAFLGAIACGGSGAPKSAVAEPARAVQRPRAAAIIGASTAERVKLAWEAAAGGYGRAVAISSTHQRVAYASKEHVALYDLRSGKLIAKAEPCNEVVHTGLAFVGAKLFLVCDDQLVAYAAGKLVAVQVPAVATPRITAAAFAGDQLALGHRDGVVRVYDLRKGARIEVTVPGPPIDVKSLALSSDAKRLAVAWVQGSVWWWDLAAPKQFRELIRHEAESDALAFDHTGQVLAEEGARHTTTLWELTEPAKQRAKLQGGDWVKQILFSADDKLLVRGGSDGLHLSEINGPRRVVLDAAGKIEDVAADERFATLAAADRNGRLSVWRVR